MKIREILLVVFCATYTACSWFQGSPEVLDPTTDEVQNACIASCSGASWALCNDERSLDAYLPIGEMLTTLEECSMICNQVADHLNPETLRCITHVKSCQDLWDCLDAN